MITKHLVISVVLALERGGGRGGSASGATAELRYRYVTCVSDTLAWEDTSVLFFHCIEIVLNNLNN